MAKTNPSTVILKGTHLMKEAPLEALDACGNGFITPGMLCEMYGTDVRPHATDGGEARPIIVAVEGLNIDSSSLTLGDIDVDYDTDAMAVKLWFPQSGDEAYMLLAPLTSVSINAVVDSNGDGYLGTGSTNPIGRALETVNNAAGTDPARIRIAIL